MTQATAGVDLGGTKIQTVVVATGEVIGQSRHPTPNTNAADVVAEIVASIHSALDDAGMTLSELQAIAIGSPGSVDVDSGHVSNARNVPGFFDDVARGPSVSASFNGISVLGDNVGILSGSVIDASGAAGGGVFPGGERVQDRGYCDYAVYDPARCR